MEKRILLAFVLSGLVMFVYYGLLAPPSRPIPPPPPPAASEATLAEPALEGLHETALESATAASPPAGSTEDVKAEFAEDVRIDTARYSAIISNEGGVLRSLRLKDYLDHEGAPIELINQDAAASVGWPLLLETGDLDMDEGLRSALYVAERTPDGVRLEFAVAGLHAVKEFRFDQQNHRIEVNASLTRDGQPEPFSLVWQGGFGDQSKDFDATYRAVVYREAGEFEREYISSVEAGQDIASTTEIGLEDQYFLAMFLLEGSSLVRIEAEPFAAAEEAIQTVAIRIPSPRGTLQLYVGPKEQDSLRAVSADLVPVIDYGFFDILARPLLFGLLWIYSYVGNYGWSIIVLTLLINGILFPLRLKQQLSMLKMQKIQPQMKTLQDKYKKLKSNDPRRQEVQAEMMGLYKKHGVNPMGGCLPLLLQMPFLFAFFSLLRVAIEVRGEPWMLWIQDLSAPDPFYILPVLMGVSMFAMQKMSPTTMDPTQARVMMMMPVMLSGMFILVPVSAGLMLYWLTSNVVGVVQQVFINKYWAPAAGSKSKPAALPAIPVEAKVVEENLANDSAVPKRRKRRSRHK